MILLSMILPIFPETPAAKARDAKGLACPTLGGANGLGDAVVAFP